MKFNFSTEVLIVVFLFLTVIFISSYGSTRVMPFEANPSTLPMFPYRDGFSDYNAVSPAKVSPHMDVKPKEETEMPDRMQKLNWGEYGSEHLIDVVSELPGSPSCRDDSAGLSNSKGYLCTTKDIKTLYKPRGGNASGQPSQIGA